MGFGQKKETTGLQCPLASWLSPPCVTSVPSGPFVI
jgi:hypothetical protein